LHGQRREYPLELAGHFRDGLLQGSVLLGEHSVLLLLQLLLLRERSQRLGEEPSLAATSRR
jgi:hypothetical protein